MNVFEKMAIQIYDDFILFTPTILKAAILLVITMMGAKLSVALICKFFEKKSKFKLVGEEKRIDTIQSIIVSVVRYTIYFIGFTPILEMFGIKMSSVIAAAGVGGLAVGFGAQSLVKDVITGFFILLENQFQVGDHVIIDDLKGIVEEMTLRVTTLRNLNGDVHIIPNGSIVRVTNKCKGTMKTWIEIAIAYEEDIDNVIDKLNNLFNSLENKNILGKAKVIGVTGFGSSEVVLTIMIPCTPLKQWEVETFLRKEIKNMFNKENIEIPYPKRVIMQEKN